MSQVILIPRSAPPRPWLARMRQQIRSIVRPLKNLSEITIADRYFSNGEPSNSGVYVSAETAFTFSAVYDAVNQIASDIGKLPLELRKRRKGAGSEPFEDSKLYRLLKYEPNPEMGSMTFRRTLTAHALTLKGGYAEIVRDGNGRPTAMWPLTPERVQPFRERDGVGRLGPLKYKIDGTKVLDAHNVLHIRGLGFDGYVGYSIVDKARQVIGVALAAERFLGAFFGNGTRFGGVLSSDQDLDEPQKEEVRQAVLKLHEGPDKAFKLLVLGAGFKFEQSGVTPSDSKLDEIRDKAVEDVARFYRLQPYRLGLNKPGTVSYASVEMSNLDYYTGCLLDWIGVWEEETNRKLIAPLESRQQFVKFEVKGFLRGDMKTRFEAYAMALDKGLYSRNEVRDLEDMNPQTGSGGDLYLVQSAQVPLSKVEEMADATIEKTKQPPPAPIAPPKADHPADNGAGERAVSEANARADAAQTAADEARAALSIALQERATLEGSATLSFEQSRSADEKIEGLIAAVSASEQIAKDRQAEADQLRTALATAQESIAASGLSIAQAEQRAVDAETAASSALEARVEAERLAAAREVEVREAQASADAAQRLVEASAVELACIQAERQADAVALAEALRSAEEASTVSDLATAERAAALVAAEAAQAEAIRAKASHEEARLAQEAAEQAAEELRVEQARIVDGAAERWAAEVEAVKTAAATETISLRAELNALGERLDEEQDDRVEAERVAEAVRVQHAEAARALEEATARLAEETEARELEVAALRVQAEASDAARTQAETDRAETEARSLAVAEAAERARVESERITAQAAASERRAVEMAASLADATAARELAESERLEAEARAALVAESVDAGRVEAERAAALAAETETRVRAEAEALALRLAEATAALERGESERRQIEAADDLGMAGVIAAHRGLVLDVMRRMVERETDRARRAQATPEKLRRWMETFYEGHEDLMRTALLPAVRIHLAFTRSEEDAIELTRRLVQGHVTESQRQLLNVLEGDADEIAASLPALLHRWDMERTSVIADRLMQTELDYARKR